MKISKEVLIERGFIDKGFFLIKKFVVNNRDYYVEVRDIPGVDGLYDVHVDDFRFVTVATMYNVKNYETIEALVKVAGNE